MGIKLDEQKIKNIDSNPIYVELAEKVNSGELEVNRELGILLVQSMKDAHIDAGIYLKDIFNIFIYVGLFLVAIASSLAFVTWKSYKNNAKNT